ncbi:MAG: PfkB family carbohydrate kinase [Planctomycetota bacterium]|jgi:fructokinase|nr:PfkB family carbohydrate kinase [Planctomycetota bacterium]MDP7251608.1 PfkB family carbohydrate kinase [Planctomycetota bacterium]
MRILAIGEILWDVFPERELIGGATFNFSAHAARLGHEVRLVSGVGNDERGRLALERAKECHVDTEYIHSTDELPTGHVSVFLDEHGQPDYTIHRPAAYDLLGLSDRKIQELIEWKPDWVYYGTVHQMDADVRRQTKAVIDAFPDIPQLFYDINLRKDSYTRELLDELLNECGMLKISEEEVSEVGRLLGLEHTSLKSFLDQMKDRYDIDSFCVTRGALGCYLDLCGMTVDAAGYKVEVADAVGAGDAFSAALIHALDSGWVLNRAADFANRVGALIASKNGAVPEWSLDELEALKE